MVQKSNSHNQTLTTKTNFMKEISNEMRARVFAAYWGADYISTYNGRGSTHKVDATAMAALLDEKNYGVVRQLLLHRLEDITDDHAIEVAKILKEPVPKSAKDMSVSKWNKLLIGDIFLSEENEERLHYSVWVELIDYLRSKSYALPFMGIDLFASGIAIAHDIKNVG